MFYNYALTLAILLVVAFCAGMIIPVLGKSLLRPDSQNMLVRLCCFLKAKSGYLASFALGAVLMWVCEDNISPYTVARWSGVYEDATLGSLITSEKTILETGQIPQDILDWYAANKK